MKVNIHMIINDTSKKERKKERIMCKIYPITHEIHNRSEMHQIYKYPFDDKAIKQKNSNQSCSIYKQRRNINIQRIYSTERGKRGNEISK